MLNFTQLPPLSLYIHMPWCVKKCPYCDFNSYRLHRTIPEQDYIQALLQDLEQDLPLIGNREIISIFIGGGTPSLFSPESIDYLLRELQTRLTFAETIEITLEANPGTTEYARFAGFKEAGINRLSIGIQSLQNDKLKVLGRIHNSETAIQAVQAALAAGFTNLNVDLMFGLPKQTLQDALYDLQTAIQLKPTHLSWYQLTLEPNTLFHARPPQLPSDDLCWEIQEQGQQLLAQHGYQQYEISAYSQQNKQCRHNRNYWEFGDYLGIGTGAHGKITLPETRQIVRLAKLKHPKDYLNKPISFIAEKRLLTQEELPFEFMLNALRLKKPISFELFEQHTGLKRDVLMPYLAKAEEMDFIKINSDNFMATALGWQFLNNLQEIFLPGNKKV